MILTAISSSISLCMLDRGPPADRQKHAIRIVVGEFGGGVFRPGRGMNYFMFIYIYFTCMHCGNE